MGGLFIDIGPDDLVRIGDTVVSIERKSGSRARLRIVGPAEVELQKKARLKQATRPDGTPYNFPAADTGD